MPEPLPIFPIKPEIVDVVLKRAVDDGRITKKEASEIKKTTE